MKIYKVLSILLGIVLISSCKKEEFNIGTPYSKVKGISAHWVLKEVWQADEIAETPPLNVSSVMVGDVPSTLSFTDQGRNYSMDPGSSVQYIPVSGTWSFDDEEYPTQVVLNNNGENYTLHLKKPVRELVDTTLEFQYIRPIGNCVSLSGGKTGAVSYIYKYIRQ